jgi:hypothetical protein
MELSKNSDGVVLSLNDIDNEVVPLHRALRVFLEANKDVITWDTIKAHELYASISGDKPLRITLDDEAALCSAVLRPLYNMATNVVAVADEQGYKMSPANQLRLKPLMSGAALALATEIELSMESDTA